MKRYRKRCRLEDFGYKGYHRYFVTICTHNRIPIFENDRLVRRSIKILKDVSNKLGFKVWAYCFMPDHLHLLVEGNSPDSDLKRFVASYKQHTGYHFKRDDDAGEGFDPASQEDVAQGFSPADEENVVQGFSPGNEKDVAQGFSLGNEKDVAQGFSPAQTAQTKKPKLWQPSYYDHVLRKDEDILSVARYVVGNPVRKALVKHFLDYEFVGSFELDVESLL